jgi:hypothetical protein
MPPLPFRRKARLPLLAQQSPEFQLKTARLTGIGSLWAANSAFIGRESFLCCF